MKLLFWVMVLFFTGCAPALWLPRSENFSDAEFSKLMLGRELYADRCSGCHNLFLPESRTASKWGRVVDWMGKKAKISDDEKQSILRYLETAVAVPDAKGNRGTMTP